MWPRFAASDAVADPQGLQEETMMHADRSFRRSLSVVLAFAFLVAPLYLQGEAAEREPVGASSATPMEKGTIILPEHEAPIITPKRTFGVEGGRDIPLLGAREPTIAVNPLNANNIAVAGLRALRVSTDNGVTFSAATNEVFPPGFVSDGDPSLAFDSQGRLFWTYLGGRTDNNLPDVFVAQVDPTTGAILPGYPVNVTAAAGFPAGAGNDNDKEWIAADHSPRSPFRGQLYIVWSQIPTMTVYTTFSTDQGLTWSPALTLSAAAGEEGMVWPSHNAVAPNGDVYVAYHSQPRFTDAHHPDGTSGQVFVLRSTDGGATYPQKTLAYTPGNADITFNVQTVPQERVLNGSISWTQGSAQAWVLPDPVIPNNVYVVAANDPTNTNQGNGFAEIDVFIARSTDHGRTWGAPVQVNDGPVDTTHFFPTAAIDDKSRCLTITWYDTRAGSTNAAGHFLLDLFLRSSRDGGLTFGPEVQLNDVPFDPDLGAPCRFGPQPPCGAPLPPLQTLRIGEYNGVAVAHGIAHAVWTGNTATGQQILFDSAHVCRERKHE
jgi:hypothetical protein